jgi:glycosyltransferase involved in cell wall biosynthesis
LKILSVIEAFCQGGAQTVLLDVLLWLTQYEHRVIHFSRANGIAPEPTFLEALRSAGVDCIDAHWNSLRDPQLRSQILDGFPPDAVVFHWWGKDPWMPWVASPRTGKPAFICVLHHSGIPVEAGYDRYVLVARSQLPQVADIPPSRVRMIPNGIDLRRFPLPPERHDHPHNHAHDHPIDLRRRPFVVGRLSELRDGKIPAGWVSTLASYRLENTRFVIAGDGALLPLLRESARGLKSEVQVSFPGYVPRHEVPALLDTFDVFCYVTSSAVECCPLAILEAMAAGLPVVAEARGGMPEIVVNGENGLLAHSIEEIGDLLRRLRDDVALRERLGRGARATAERFSLEKQVTAYGNLLADSIREREAGDYAQLEASVKEGSGSA